MPKSINKMTNNYLTIFISIEEKKWISSINSLQIQQKIRINLATIPYRVFEDIVNEKCGSLECKRDNIH